LSAFDSTHPDRPARALPIALFGTAMVWFVASQILAARSARGLTNRFNLDSARPLVSSLFLLFLLAVGFSLLATIARRPLAGRRLLGLPRRPTAGREWLLGAAIGWGAVVVSVLPLALTGALTVGFWTEPRAFGLILVNLAAVAAGSLAEEVVFRGYPFRCLIEAIGQTRATLVLASLYGFVHTLAGDGSFASFLITFLAGILLAVGWLRTHGLWLPWGLHFAWNAGLGILFGLPVTGSVDGSTVIQTTAYGRTLFTGGSFGPEAGLFTVVGLTVALIALVRTTRDYAWNYTHPVILPEGFPMDVPPPSAHTAMEQQRAPQPTLVQILPTTPQGRSLDEEQRP
jgi:membrane protease YdiL (CAAX protease family)